MKNVGRDRRAAASATRLSPSPAVSGQPSEGSSIAPLISIPAPRELPAPTPKRCIKRTRSLSPQRGDRISVEKRTGSFPGDLSTDVPTTFPPVKNKFDFIQEWVDSFPTKLEPLVEEKPEPSSASGGIFSCTSTVQTRLGKRRRRTWTREAEFDLDWHPRAWKAGKNPAFQT